MAGAGVLASERRRAPSLLLLYCTSIIGLMSQAPAEENATEVPQSSSPQPANNTNDDGTQSGIRQAELQALQTARTSMVPKEGEHRTENYGRLVCDYRNVNSNTAQSSGPPVSQVLSDLAVLIQSGATFTWDRSGLNDVADAYSRTPVPTQAELSTNPEEAENEDQANPLPE